MGVRDVLLKVKNTVSARMENPFGHEAGIDPGAVRREILREVESRIVLEADNRVFPFDKVVVRLQPQSQAQSRAIEKTLIEKDALKTDILQTLKAARARFPNELDAIVEIGRSGNPDLPASLSSPVFEMDFIQSNPPILRNVPEIRLKIIKGTAEKKEYVLKKDRILVGRAPEVLDREGRMVRRNDVVFLEGNEEINLSVARTQARIWFDYEKSDFFILDEGSRYGTRILRGGAVIEVPGEQPEGMRLQAGDDVYCGQACIRFEPV